MEVQAKSVNLKRVSDEPTYLTDFLHLFEEDAPLENYTQNIIGARTLNRSTNLYKVTFKKEALHDLNNHQSMHNQLEAGKHYTTKTGKKNFVTSRLPPEEQQK